MYSHGFLKVAAASPTVKLADPIYNVEKMLELLDEISLKNPSIVSFPEMGVPGYSIGDLIFQDYLYDSTKEAISYFLKNNKYNGVVIFGSYLIINDCAYNCAFVCQKDQILGIVPKSYLPHTNEFYESRWFASGNYIVEDCDYVNFLGEDIPFGKVLFTSEKADVCFGVEICGDMWSPVSPNESLFTNGALIVFNLSASPAEVGKVEERRVITKATSFKFNGAYVYVSNNGSESSSEVIFSNHKIICENGEIIAENNDITLNSNYIIADLDINKLHFLRRNNSYFKSVQDQMRDDQFIFVDFDIDITKEFVFEKKIDLYPYVPKDKKSLQEIIDIQAAALIKRLHHIGIEKTILGVSGGLDSTLALLSLCYAYDKYGIDRKNILGFTLPSKATSDRTYSNSIQLMKKLGVTYREIPIYDACKNQLEVIGHDENNTDVTYENVQARYRTFTLMNLANENKGIVIGTSDMSEVALGWSTFNGDHMAMYGINAGLPKTTVRKVVEYYCEIYPDVSDILQSIIDTPISPELSNKGQTTESIIGKYEINDFILYHFLENGDDTYRIVYLLEKFMNLTKEEAKKYVDNFNKRFYSQQYKRLTAPESPKIMGISLSPRTEIRLNGDIVRRDKKE